MMNLDFSNESIIAAMNEFKNKKNGDGKRGPFYNRTQAWMFDKDDAELFKNAVWQAYLDASRTFSGIKDTGKDHGAFLNLAKSIKAYFDSDSSCFEHDKWCSDFIKDIKQYHGYQARYGQAQKVVNMAFKYLYCCEGTENYRSRFEACHMPLDQFTLAWLFSEGGFLYQEWSWFDLEKYQEASKAVRDKLENDILGKELVIWKETQGRIINLKDCCGIK